VPVATFDPNRRQRRIRRRNRDLVVVYTEDISDKAAYELYRRYIEDRHADGDMYPPDRDQYESFLSNEWGCTDYYRFYDQGDLIAIAVVDVLQDGLSAIYTFFDPAASRRSLGGYAILWLIDKAREVGLEYLYLGYWIRGCQKMDYKSEYRPLELYLNNRWTSLL
jgi:arginine-tRNA-protein transferase